MAASTKSLTLGDLHRSLRGELGENAPCRVILVFEQRSTLAPRAPDGEVSPGLFTKRAFKAEIDFDPAGLRRADLQSTGMTTTPHAHVAFVHDEDAYFYSIDGVHFGHYETVPDLFDLRDFEKVLDVVSVNDVTIDRGRAADGTSLSELDVDLDVRAFRRLLRAFGSDPGAAPDDLELNSYNLHLAAGGDVTVDYWWQLAGDENIENEQGALETFSCRVTCHVTLRLVALTAIPSTAVPLDDSLPTLNTVDDVWAAARYAQGPRGVPWD